MLVFVRNLRKFALLLVALMLAALIPLSCSNPMTPPSADSANCYARWFEIEGDSLAISISPHDGSRDTLSVREPLRRLVCMSSSHVAFLSVLGCDSSVVGISGGQYLSNQIVRSLAKEVGYDATFDYEAVLSLRPDLVLAYSPSATPPIYAERLKSLGVRVFMIYEHLENHPLARAEYVRLFGLMENCSSKADSIFSKVESSYLKQVVSTDTPVKAILNLPYGGQWFVPGAENYMCRLISDAGGEVLGAREGLEGSSCISFEEAVRLASRADVWLNPGWCRSREQLYGINRIFRQFPSVIYNNNLKALPSGGNDFWESGVVRPDLVLSDLRRIFSGTSPVDSLNYYLRVD